MRSFFVFPIVLVAIQSYSTQAVRTCSPDVITSIKLLWAKDGTPKNLIKEAVAAKKQNILKTSKDYYPAGTSCSYTLFTDESSVTLTTVVNGEKEEEKESVYEKDGVVIEKQTGIKRYHVFSKDGVAAWYKCADTVKAAFGEPEGAIKVPNGNAYNKAHVKTAEEKLKSVGITMTTEYKPDC